MAFPLALPVEDVALDLSLCDNCTSTQIMGEVCLQCGRCQMCGEFADDCMCEVSAFDRYVDADYQNYVDAYG